MFYLIKPQKVKKILGSNFQMNAYNREIDKEIVQHN
jgi:hypothetical protein